MNAHLKPEPRATMGWPVRQFAEAHTFELQTRESPALYREIARF